MGKRVQRVTEASLTLLKIRTMLEQCAAFGRELSSQKCGEYAQMLEHAHETLTQTIYAARDLLNEGYEVEQ